MKRGFHTEAHVVAYCHVCGDIYTDADGESICFDTTAQAVEFLAVDTATGWAFDGDLVRCETCLIGEQCRRDGHDFIYTRYQPPLLDTIECSRCGLLAPEQEI
ncbi:hypothetical protein ACIGO9_23325 [Nocardia asteroides]|uniref:hypothetical protein n=1 Tax=Nocardia asteroides TaxID=1824 RepID=UPI0037CAEB56